MSEPIEHADPTVPQIQQRTVQVLATLLAVPNLPAATWNLSDVLPTELQGMIPDHNTDGLRAWAEAFGAPVDWDRHNGQHPETRFTINGVTVFVWTAVKGGEQ